MRNRRASDAADPYDTNGAGLFSSTTARSVSGARQALLLVWLPRHKSSLSERYGEMVRWVRRSVGLAAVAANYLYRVGAYAIRLHDSYDT
jgi:hypothetical protein